jgi:glycosyltransferase involved in cell wall biosynthesis
MNKAGNKPVVLCWAGWFPHEERPNQGIFVRRHLELIGSEVVLHTFTIRHKKGFHFRCYDVAESFGKVRHYEVPSFFLLKFLGYFLLPLWEFFRGSRLYGRPDVFYLHVSYPYAVFSLPLNFLGLQRRVLTEHWSGYLPDDGRFRELPAWYRRLLQMSLRRFDCILPVSEFLKRHMVAACSIAPKRFRVVPNAVRFPSILQPLPPLNPETSFRLLCIASLHDSVKNISLLLHTMKHVRKRIPKVHLKVAGEGPDKEKLMALTAQLGLKEYVQFLGYVPNEKVELLYSETHLFVLLSRYETFSVVVAEALSHGRPVVISECGGPEEYVTVECGRIVPRENSTAAANAIVEIYKNYGSFSAENIQTHARGTFNSPKVKFQILKALGININF